jgi:hypothetical protein
MFTEGRDLSVVFPVNDVPPDKAMLVQRIEHGPEVHGIMGQNVGLELARLPEKTAGAVRDRPESSERQAQRQPGFLFGVEQVSVLEERGADQARSTQGKSRERMGKALRAFILRRHPRLRPIHSSWRRVCLGPAHGKTRRSPARSRCRRRFRAEWPPSFARR